MKLYTVVVTALLLCILVSGYRRENADTVKTDYVSNSVVSVECNDEREPVVKRAENATRITVTCKLVQ